MLQMLIVYIRVQPSSAKGSSPLLLLLPRAERVDAAATAAPVTALAMPPQLCSEASMEIPCQDEARQEKKIRKCGKQKRRIAFVANIKS